MTAILLLKPRLHCAALLASSLMVMGCQSEAKPQIKPAPKAAAQAITPSVDNGLLEPAQARKRDYLDYSKDIRDETQILRADGKHFAMRSDANKDGKLDFAEFTHHKHAIYMKWDKNLDGVFSREEFRVRGSDGQSPDKAAKINKKFDANDKDGSGNLELEEFGEVWRRNFNAADKDDDGFLSAMEMKNKQALE